MNRFRTSIFVAALMLVYASALAQSYLFVGSYNFNKNKQGIYVYRLDTVTGDLEFLSSTRGIPNPSYVTLSPNGRYLYACAETQTQNAGSVCSFEFDPPKGKLTFINSQPSGGENPVYIAADKTGKWLVNANYTEGSISVYPLDAGGSIQPVRQLRTFTEGSSHLPRQDRAHVHCVAFSPAQDRVFFPDLGADKIRSYSFDAAKYSPLSSSADSFIATVPASGPRHMVFHPKGRFAYCTEELGGFISVYAYNNGRLDSIQRVATHTKEKPDIFSNFSNADVHLSPDGRFLYASCRGHQNSIYIFSVNETTGRLSYVDHMPVHGNHPRSFTLTPSGNMLVVANQVSGNVVVFLRDARTGLLTRTRTNVKILNPSSVVVRSY